MEFDTYKLFLQNSTMLCPEQGLMSLFRSMDQIIRLCLIISVKTNNSVNSYLTITTRKDRYLNRQYVQVGPK